jgi:hypothetical protein
MSERTTKDKTELSLGTAASGEVPNKSTPEHEHVRSWLDKACNCWRCECGAYIPREVR